MRYYKETQQGGVIGLSLIIFIVIVVLGFIIKGEIEEVSDLGFYVVVLSLLIVFALFSKLRTLIEDDKISLKFGIGIFKRKIPISSISSVEVVRNKWYYGWGIRFYGKGWMWNYKGLDAVELHFKNKKGTFRIGSGKAEELKNTLDRLINTK